MCKLREPFSVFLITSIAIIVDFIILVIIIIINLINQFPCFSQIYPPIHHLIPYTPLLSAVLDCFGLFYSQTKSQRSEESLVYLQKPKNLLMLSVRISSYGCTLEVWRARKMRKSSSRRSREQKMQVHP